MSGFKRVILAAMCILIFGTGVMAQVPEMSSTEKAGCIIDKLLLETPYVYIEASHKMASFAVPETGLFFTGDIMLDPYARACSKVKIKNVKMVATNAQDIVKAILELSQLSKLAEVPELKDCGIDFKAFEGFSKFSELSRFANISNLENLSELEDLDIDIKSDGCSQNKPEITVKERLEAFKAELVDTLLANAELFSKAAGNDVLTVVFQVYDKDFKTLQGTSYLRTQIPVKKLLKYKGSSSKNSAALKAFVFNW